MAINIEHLQRGDIPRKVLARREPFMCISGLMNPEKGGSETIFLTRGGRCRMWEGKRKKESMFQEKFHRADLGLGRGRIKQRERPEPKRGQVGLAR